MPEILIITTRARWEQALAEGEYRGDTLATEGFIHCSTPEQFDSTSSQGPVMSETSEPASGPGVKSGIVGSARSLLQAGRERLLASMTPRRRRLIVRAVKTLGVAVALWLVAAYVVLPAVWRHYEHHPALEDAPRTTVTAQGIPGDPLNVGLIGIEEQVVRAMLDSGWEPADPVTLRTSFRIARSVLMNRPYAGAPVSPLFLFGRVQDLAFERPVGGSARRRHHVRFWRSTELGRGGVPLWIGAVTFDRSVGLSHRTGQITHHIGPDIDAERDELIAGLRQGGWLSQIFQVTGVGATLVGRNGGGDRYDTDGELTVGVLVSGDRRDRRPERLENPVPVQIKEQLWTAIRPLLRSLPGQ